MTLSRICSVTVQIPYCRKWNSVNYVIWYIHQISCGWPNTCTWLYLFTIMLQKKAITSLKTYSTVFKEWALLFYELCLERWLIITSNKLKLTVIFYRQVNVTFLNNLYFSKIAATGITLLFNLIWQLTKNRSISVSIWSNLLQ